MFLSRSHEKKRAHLTSPGHLEKIGQANNTMNTSGLNVSGSGTPTPSTPQINYNNSFLSMDLSKLASVVPVAYAAPRPSAKMVSTVSAGSKRTLAERSSGSPAPTARTTSSTPNHSSVRKTQAPAAADNAIPARRSSTASSAPKHASTPTSKPVNSKSIHDESERAEKGKVYICPWCDDPFELGSKLRRHSSKVHHKKTTICPFCTETFRTDEARDSHEAEAHGDQVYKPEAKSSPEKESPRKSLSSRQKDVGYEEADSTASSVDEDAEGEIECENCPLLFSTEEDLKEHISEMHPFQCPQCPEKRYKSSKGVQKHYRERHPREEVFICKPCVVCFSKKSAFQKHQNEHVLDEEEDDSQQELEATPAKVRRVSEDIQTPPPSTRAKRASGNPAEARILRVSEDTPASPPRSKRSSGSSSSDLASSTPVTRLKRSSGSDSLISPATPLLEKRMKRDSVETSLESPLVKRDRRMSGVRVLVPVATKVRIPSGTTVMSAEMSKEVELACIKETLEAESVANDEDFKAGEGRPKSPDFYGFATVEASESGKCEEIKKGLASAIEAIKAEDS